MQHPVKRQKVTAPRAGNPSPEIEMERIEHTLSDEDFATILPVLQVISNQNEKLAFFLNHVIKVAKLPTIPKPGYEISEDGRRLIGIRPKPPQA